jgi:hypothetical protein
MWLNMNSEVQKHGGKRVDEQTGRPMWFACLHAGTAADFNTAFDAFRALYPEAAAFVGKQDPVRVPHAHAQRKLQRWHRLAAPVRCWVCAEYVPPVR